MKRIIDKQTKLFIRDDFEFNRETEIGLEVEPAQGFYAPKWNGESWEEGATQEYIDSLKPQPQEPTESERLEALEMLMLDILGGGF
jgi:hypothetical protein